jgi:sulfate transport system ATP-binding protein
VATQLEVVGLTKRFTVKGTPAVFENTFSAAPGGITTLLGPSGSGKTTLLRVIAGLEHADEGRVLVDGRDITEVPVRARDFGFVFQTFALFPQLSVRENIAFGLRVRKASPTQLAARVDELLALVKLDGLADRLPAQLSGGQRQRVGFARALAPYPKVLLLDEPFGALDVQVRLELRQFLTELHAATHVTTLLVTHDQEEALELSDRIVVLDKGRIHQVGTPREIYEAPSTSFVASFVGMANVIQGRVRGGATHLHGIAVAVPEGIPDGASIQAVVRPEDIRLRRASPDETPTTAEARVQRIAFVGAFAKLDVVTQDGQRLSVRLSQDELAVLRLQAGDSVSLDLSRVRMFPAARTEGL